MKKKAERTMWSAFARYTMMYWEVNKLSNKLIFLGGWGHGDEPL